MQSGFERTKPLCDSAKKTYSRKVTLKAVLECLLSNVGFDNGDYRIGRQGDENRLTHLFLRFRI